MSCDQKFLFPKKKKKNEKRVKNYTFFVFLAWNAKFNVKILNRFITNIGGATREQRDFNVP
jgi:hypothetical protein